MEKIVAVTGATGNVGKALAGNLLGRGVGIRAIARRTDRLSGLMAMGARVFAGRIEDTEFLAHAFRGTGAVFLMMPPNLQAPDLRAYQVTLAESLAAALVRAGVTHAVSLSGVGADLASGNGPIAGLHFLEQRLNAVEGLHVVHLRATSFMENILGSVGLIKGRAVNGSPLIGDLPISMIATRDIARVAAEILGGATFTGKTARELLGPREYSMNEVTRILGRAIGEPDIAYVQFPYDEARKAMVGAGISQSVADAFNEMYRGFNDGTIRPREARSAQNTTPTTLEEFSKVFAAAYQAA